MPNTYYDASFSAELEAAATPMWALVSHLKGTFWINYLYILKLMYLYFFIDKQTQKYTANVLKYCLKAIQEWWKTMNYDSPYIVGCLYTYFS